MAVILGCDENAYGIARVYYKNYGIVPIALANTMLEPCRKTKILDVVIDEKLHDPDHLIEKLLELGDKLKKEYEKIFLIPCSDAYLEILSERKDELGIYENVFVEASLLRKFNSKKTFYDMCEKYGLSYPKSLVCTKDNYEKVLKNLDFSFPLILKPNNSNSFKYLDASFDGKEKVYFIDDSAELANKIEMIYSSSYDDILIIQEYIRGDDTAMRILNTYSDKFGHVKVASFGQPILEEYHPLTFGNYAATISCVKNEPFVEDIINFLNDIHYVGAANFDIKIDNVTGKYYIFEINPRLGRGSLYSTLAGASIADAFVQDLVDDHLEEKLENDEEILWVNVPHVLLKKYIKNEDVKKHVEKLRREHKVTHALFCKEDKVLSRLYITAKQYARKVHYFPKYFIEKK